MKCFMYYGSKYWTYYRCKCGGKMEQFRTTNERQQKIPKFSCFKCGERYLITKSMRRRLERK